MDKWKPIHVGGATVLVWAISSHVLKDPGADESHSHTESQMARATKWDGMPSRWL